ncbi:MAG TPA: glycosyltransferase family 4 protein [Thermoleophilaceae bacterium]|nr:glycosyltransferase family 4 protein [Thermoleophilaceae bacterium]
MPRALLVFEPPDGGVAEHVLQLATRLSGEDVQVRVAGPAESVIYPALERAGVPFERLPFGRSLRPGPYGRATARLRALARSGDYDLLHVHSSKAGGVARIAAIGSGLPVVYTPHCFPFIGPQSRGRRLVTAAAERALAKLTTAIVCVSDDERRQALALRTAPAARLHVIHNGSPPCETADEPDSELARWAADGPVAACVTVLRRQKGVDVFLRAAPRILDAVPGARLAVVGDGPEGPALRAQSAELDLGERVRFFDFRAPAARQLGQVDVFVLASRWEAFPISVLEAMACGVPQVATDVGGTGEAVQEGVTGTLCAPEDPEALAAAVIGLLEAPERRAEMADASRARHAERFGVDRMVAATAALYRSLAL